MMQFVDGWLVEAQEYNLMGNSESRNGLHPTHLVIHATAGGSDGGGVAAYMGTHGVSTHFVISTDGTIWQCVDVNAAAWANAPLKSPLINFARADINPNLWTVSIEFCKPDDTNQINITDAQMQSGFPLIRLICETYGIPKRAGDGSGGVIRHADINSIDRARCPGTFPFDKLWPFLNGGSMAGIPNGWIDNGHTLTAPNGIPVILGFRDYILSHSWDAGNWPLAPEQGVPQLELSNPSLGAGTQQLFRTKMLGWTAERGVFEEWIGQELFVARRVLAALKTPPADIVALLTTLLGASEQLSTQIQAALKQLQGAS